MANDNVKCFAPTDEPTELSPESAVPLGFTKLYSEFQSKLGTKNQVTFICHVAR